MRILNEMELTLVEGGCDEPVVPEEPECPSVPECEPPSEPTPICKPRPRRHHHHHHSCGLRLWFCLPKLC